MFYELHIYVKIEKIFIYQIIYRFIFLDYYLNYFVVNVEKSFLFQSSSDSYKLKRLLCRKPQTIAIPHYFIEKNFIELCDRSLWIICIYISFRFSPNTTSWIDLFSFLSSYFPSFNFLQVIIILIFMNSFGSYHSRKSTFLSLNCRQSL